MCDEISVILEAKTCEDRDLSLDAYIWWCIGLSLHTLNLNINKELVHADFRHFWLAALVSELIREKFAQGLGRGGIASTKGQTVELSWNSDILGHPFTTTVNESLQACH